MEKEVEPALTPYIPAFFKPIFFTIKLEPMKKLEERANANPRMLSEDISIAGAWIPTLQVTYSTNKSLKNQTFVEFLHVNQESSE